MRKNGRTPCKGEMNETKVVIIGGGVSGALSCFELAQRGYDVTLIEAKSIGNGSSQRSAACIRQQFSTSSTVRGMMYCVDYFRNWNTRLGLAGGLSPITQNGYLFLKGWDQSRESVEQLVAMQQASGLTEVEILNPEEIATRFPYIDTRGVAFATWCPSDGYLQPGIVYSDSIQAARMLGATIIQNDAVVSADTQYGDNAKIEMVHLASGKTISGDVFINTANAWAPQVSAILGGDVLDIKARKRYLYFASLKNREFISDENLDALPMIITPYGSYVRKEGRNNNSVMMGKLHYTHPVHPTFEDQDVIEPTLGYSNLDDYGVSVQKEIGSYVMDIENALPKNPTTGYYADTPDHNPYIGYDGTMSNVIHAAGFSGHGLMHSPFTAQIVLQLIEAKKDKDVCTLPFHFGEVDITPYRVNRIFQQSEGLVI